VVHHPLDVKAFAADALIVVEEGDGDGVEGAGEGREHGSEQVVREPVERLIDELGNLPTVEEKICKKIQEQMKPAG